MQLSLLLAVASSSATLLLLLLLPFSSLAQSAVQDSCLQSLPASRINDNYCDCGNDEPETSACSGNAMFKCRGEDYSIPSSRVGDTVCDCCDGSDETQFCNNVCEQKYKDINAKIAAEREVRTAGEEIFRQLAAQACGDDEDVSKQAEEEKMRVKKKRESVALEAAEARVEIAAEEEAMGPERIAALGLDKLERSELEMLLIKLASEVEDGREILPRLVREWTVNQQASWAEDSARLQDLKNRLNALEEEEIELGSEGERAYDPAPTKALDFGPGNVWKSLNGQCFALNKDKYRYELCLFKEMKQDGTLLGRFKNWQDGAYGEMLYGNGQYCHIGIDRSTRVRIVCGAENRLVDIVEPSTCVYEAVFESPAACVPNEYQVCNK